MSCRALDDKNSFSLLMSFTLKDCVTDPHQVGRAGAPSRPPPPCSLDRSGQPYAVAAEAAAAEMMVAPPITHISLCCCCCWSRLLLRLLRRTRKLETLTIEWQLSHHVWYMTTTIASNRPRDGPTNNFVSVFFLFIRWSLKKEVGAVPPSHRPSRLWDLSLSLFIYIDTHTLTYLHVDSIDPAIHLLFKIAILHTPLYTPTFFNTSDNQHLSQGGPLWHIKGYLQLYIFPCLCPLKRRKIK
jgi:hypothetical protein